MPMRKIALRVPERVREIGAKALYFHIKGEAGD
jgi:hypothetical protein